VALGGGRILMSEVRRLSKQRPPPLPSPVEGQGLHGRFAHKKQHPLWTLQQTYAQNPTVTLGGNTFSYKRGTPARVPSPAVVHQTQWPFTVLLRCLDL